jgi:hypothetical protein
MIEIKNPDQIKAFHHNSLFCKKIRFICDKLALEPRVQIFQAGKPQIKDGLRGATYEDLITLYWSEIETVNSLFWIFCHELRHYMMWKNPKTFQRVFETEEAILKALSKKSTKRMSLSGEARLLYDLRPTEVVGDLFATEILGRDYGDAWFETRIKRRKAQKNEQGHRLQGVPRTRTKK